MGIAWEVDSLNEGVCPEAVDSGTIQAAPAFAGRVAVELGVCFEMRKGCDGGAGAELGALTNGGAWLHSAAVIEQAV